MFSHSKLKVKNLEIQLMNKFETSNCFRGTLVQLQKSVEWTELLQTNDDEFPPG
jgi:hypothetical protein